MLADRQTNRQTDTHTHTDVLITILLHRSGGRSNKFMIRMLVYKSESRANDEMLK